MASTQKLHWTFLDSGESPLANHSTRQRDPASQLKDTERTPRADLRRVARVGTGNPFLMTGHAEAAEAAEAAEVLKRQTMTEP